MKTRKYAAPAVKGLMFKISDVFSFWAVLFAGSYLEKKNDLLIAWSFKTISCGRDTSGIGDPGGIEYQ